MIFRPKDEKLMSNHQNNKTADIVALIPRGEVIRNFIYSGAFDEIAEQAELFLLTISPNDEINDFLTRKYKNVQSLQDYRETWLVRFQREILDLAHGRWLWSKAAQERWRLRDAEAAISARRKMARTVKKLTSLPFANQPGLRVLSKIERTSSRILKTTEFYLKLYRQLKPKLVFNGSHIHSRVAIQAIQAAQWLKIPTATFIFSWDNLTSQGRIMLPYDYFLVWNETLREQLLEMYDWITPEKVFVTGTPQFDFHFRENFYRTREDFCQSIGADPARPIVLYTTGMPNHMPDEPEIVEQIADILREIAEDKRPQLLVRIYPKDLTGRFEPLKNRRRDILFPKVAWESQWLTPMYEDSYDLVNSLRHAALGINVASTVSLELCMFDKPVINVGYNPPGVDETVLSYRDYYDFDHYKPLVESGAVQVAHRPEELKMLIRTALSDPRARQRERQNLVSKMFGKTLDGQSSSRVARTLLEVAGNY